MYYDLIVVLAGIEFSALLLLNGNGISGASIGVNIHLNEGPMSGQNGSKSCKYHQRTIPNYETRIEVDILILST